MDAPSSSYVRKLIEHFQNIIGPFFLIVVVRWQGKNGKEAREETEVNSIGCTGEGKKGNDPSIREGYRQYKTGTACIWVWMWGDHFFMEGSVNQWWHMLAIAPK